MRLVRTVPLVSAALIALSCSGGSRPPASPSSVATAGEEAPAPARDAPTSEPEPAPAPEPPPGFVRMTVLGVSPDAAGNALFLTDDARTTVVPVMIGNAEAMVIELRLRHEGFERPLTHDLLDRAIEALGGTVVMVQVNKLRADVFVGTVLLWDGHEMHRLDARTSDAVAVALGHDVPIYVHEVVIAETGMPTSELGGAAPP